MELTIGELGAGEVRVCIGEWTLQARGSERVQALRLATGPFDLDLGRLQLEALVASDGTVRVQAARAAVDLRVASVGEGTEVVLHAVRLEELQVFSPAGTLEVAQVELPGDLRIGGAGLSGGAARLLGCRARREGLELALESLALAGWRSAEGAVELEQSCLEGLRVSLGGLDVGVERLELPAAAVTPKGPEVCAMAGPLMASDVTVALPRGRVALPQVTLPAGLRYGAAGLEVDGLEVEGTTLSLALVAEEPEADAAPPTELPAEEAAEAPLGSAERKRRFRFLDGLKGQLDVDLYVEATYPVYGERKVTHHFRIPIDEGAIDYKRLEKSLATLEDAVLDIELLPGELILEKDLPLIPFDNLTLVRWPLEPHEQALAEVQRVRLSTLVGAELPQAKEPEADAPADAKAPAPAGGAGEGPLALHRLELRDLDLSLALLRSGELDLGTRGRLRFAGPKGDGGAERPAASGLRVQGVLRHVARDSETAGELRLALEHLAADLDALALGDRLLSLRGLAVEQVDAEGTRVTFAGLTPQHLDASLGRISAQRLRLGEEPTPAGAEPKASDEG